jgi:hypothetical protein
MGHQIEVSLSLCTVIEQELHIQKLSLQHLSQITGINRGILSACFTRIPPKSLSIKQIDNITAGLGKQEDWLYEMYLDECFSEKVHWKQLKPFLLRCIGLNRYDLIDKILSNLMESQAHIQDIFLLGELLYSEGKWKESIPFYRCVCENEIKQHSIRMAISQYRWFRTRLGNDLKENHEAAIQFAPYRQRLPENFQLDALLQLANVHFTLQNWEEVISYAKELQALTNIILHQRNNSHRKSNKEEPMLTDRHFVFYYGQAHLLQGNALEWMGEYEESLEFIQGYEDLSGFQDLGYIGQLEVTKFQRFAEGNRLTLNILMGKFEFLPQFILFIDRNNNEWLTCFLTIIIAANQYEKNIDEAIDYYSKYLNKVLHHDNSINHEYYHKIFSSQRSAKLCYQMAIYYYRENVIEDGVKWLLQALRYSIRSNDQVLNLQCVAYFEQFRKNVLSQSVVTEYELIMKGVIEDA